MTLTDLSLQWTVIFALFALMGGFLVGQAMNGVMGPQGFGTLGNMLVLAAGFYLGLYVFDAGHFSAGMPELYFGFGTAGAFLSLFVLALLKRLLLRT